MIPFVKCTSRTIWCIIRGSSSHIWIFFSLECLLFIKRSLKYHRLILFWKHFFFSFSCCLITVSERSIWMAGPNCEAFIHMDPSCLSICCNRPAVCWWCWDWNLSCLLFCWDKSPVTKCTCCIQHLQKRLGSYLMLSLQISIYPVCQCMAFL